MLDDKPRGMSNGPEGDSRDWHGISWAKEERAVRRLRQRIFKASQDGDLKKVRNLQKLMLRSRSNTLVSVRRVTQQNAGRNTAGVDGEVVLTPGGRSRLAREVQESRTCLPKPVKRVYIPKSNGKQRPLGIPVVRDRVHQMRVKNALEPEWEARFEARSYGFRPGRSCHDAIESIFMMTRGRRTERRWVLDADLSAAFDRIHHDRLLETIGTFPARGQIRGWMKAGVMEAGRWAPTEEGTPQGGVISPLLLNIALHGMEEAAGVKYREHKGREPGAAPGTPVLVRYADDFVVLTHTEEQAREARQKLELWLEPRGLRFNEEKTSVVHVDEGFNFLGFNVRRNGNQVIIKPSKEAVRRIRERLRTEVKGLQGSNAAAVLRQLSPVVRGWATYYRGWCPRKPSGHWTTTSGDCCTSGPGAATQGSQNGGLWPITLAGSTSRGRINGCSVKPALAPTSINSPGPRSPDTSWSRARRPRTTRPSRTTGRKGDRRRHRRSWEGPVFTWHTARKGCARSVTRP